MKLLLATRNTKKARELISLLCDLKIEIDTLADYPALKRVPEDGKTFLENAIKKACYIAKATGILTLADDSGLSVSVLDGKPGIYSARFASDDKKRIEKLLQLMKDIPMKKRTAQFTCALALAYPDGRLAIASEGKCVGKIALSPKGRFGFGYDPIFYIPRLKKTYAQLSLREKNQISHRGKAMRKIKKFLTELIKKEKDSQ